MLFTRLPTARWVSKFTFPRRPTIVTVVPAGGRTTVVRVYETLLFTAAGPVKNGLSLSLPDFPPPALKAKFIIAKLLPNWLAEAMKFVSAYDKRLLVTQPFKAPSILFTVELITLGIVIIVGAVSMLKLRRLILRGGNTTGT